ncbi:zinc transporter ZIP4 [Brachionus plicatilis]|uniref:Zinc transporter ZIP4 n=1 Tax=Brachionus plicatilis TaxID=10195 RepID=A0A3M7SK93_BRAPC|nr:zinc transporter ZIP4 [Brachionus plicatilis]
MKLIKIFIFAILGSQSTFVFAIKDNIFKKPRVVKDLHESLPDKNWFLDQIFLKYSNESSNFISQSDFKEIIQNLNINYHDHDDHDHNGHDHEDHDHYHSLAKSKSENFSICYSSEQILSIFHLHDPTDLIPKNLFQEMSASLIWLGLNSGCHTQDHHNDSNQCETSTLDKYLYGSLSVIIIWVISMICVSLLGKFKDSLKFLILALKGLAIGTLLSDALLHIIPTALGIHSHDHSDDGGHDHSEEIVRDHRDPLWKMTATMTSNN